MWVGGGRGGSARLCGPRFTPPAEDFEPPPEQEPLPEPEPERELPPPGLDDLGTAAGESDDPDRDPHDVAGEPPD
ncbi:hypothetical protein [Catellatospora vulcania]|uniref:hypothetical protein n=1 Tax=Catellatospora vulcania TaxID=1460450 RepID=UPI0012D44250|nr:hypothetical protein [Catellatospora vulcania]